MNTIRHTIAALIAISFSASIILIAVWLKPAPNLRSSAPVSEQAIAKVANNLLVAGHGKQQEEPKYEPLFVDWETPTVALFVTGRQHGYIEPCGCTGLDNQKGGLLRRHTFQKQILAQGWNTVSIDAGNQIRRYGKQANIKLASTYECLCTTMNYQAIGLGPDDLRVPVIELMQVMANYGGDNNPFVCANVTVFSTDFTSRFRVIESNGSTVGITAVLGDEHIEKLPPATDMTTQPVNQALREVVPAMAAKNCSMNVLIAQTSLEKSRQLAKDFPVFDLIVTTGGSGEPTLFPEEIPDSQSSHVTQMIQVGVKGMYVGVIGLFPGKPKPLRYQRVSLDARFEDSEEVKEKFTSYQSQLQTLGLQELGLSPIRHPTNRTYVGSEVCADCHDVAYDVWKHGVEGSGDEVGPHSKATADLTDPTERVWIKRHFDPECLSCHVTGWNPQKYFPYESGYWELDNEHLHGNGCENCHGPGSDHVAAENGEIDVDNETRIRYYKEMIVTLDQAKQGLCMECHDLDNSPDFHHEGAFEKYWARIKHYEDE